MSDSGDPRASAADVDFAVREDRLRLFSFTTAEKRTDYLWVMRAFDHARANYVVLLHAGEVADILARIADDDPSGALTAGEIPPLLDQLHTWGVLERSYDGSRAATLAEYRNRHFVYQFSQAGYLAFRAVEDLLGARLEDATLSRLALPDLLSDLEELAQANRCGDGDLIYRKLARLDSTLTDMAARAAQFYLMLGDLVRTTEITPEAFLSHKDALLSHMREFSSDLARYAPKLGAAIENVEATGIESLITRAAASDDRVFLSREERESDWRARWSGLAQWFVAAAGPSESDRLREGTMSAIAAVLSLLRRVTETRRGGVSRESQLRHLAGWFAATRTRNRPTRCSSSSSTWVALDTCRWCTRTRTSFPSPGRGGTPLRWRSPARSPRPAGPPSPVCRRACSATKAASAASGRNNSPPSGRGRSRRRRWRLPERTTGCSTSRRPTSCSACSMPHSPPGCRSPEPFPAPPGRRTASSSH